MDPEVMFGWGKHLNFNAIKNHEIIQNTAVRTQSHLMSSIWAEKTQEELLSRCPTGTVLPIIANSDGVAIGATNQSVNTAMGTFGNCDDMLGNQLCSKFLIGKNCHSLYNLVNIKFRFSRIHSHYAGI
jgi:hypothetical protein